MVINKPIFQKPIIHGDYDVWGDKINTILDLQDSFNGSVKINVDEHSTAISNLDNNKLNIADISTHVTPVMDNYFENTVKVNIDNYVTNTSLVSINDYVDTKKATLDNAITQADALTITLTAQNNTASTNIQTLQTENATSVTNYNNLVTENGSAVTNNNNLTTTIANAVTAKDELNTSISNSVTAKNNLNDSIADSVTKKNELDTVITNSVTSKTNLQNKIDEVPALIQSITDEGDTQIGRLVNGGFVEITDLNTDFPIQAGYYEIVDANNNQYSVRVGADLLIPNNSVIHDVSGFIRVQGVKTPCKVVVRTYPTITTNTKGAVLLEMESDFANVSSPGTPVGIKNLINEVDIPQPTQIFDKLDRGGYTDTAQKIYDDGTRIATSSQRGQVKIGANLTVDAEGTVSGILQDLSYLQPRIDNSLDTESKNVVPAINENRKRILALLGKNPSGTVQNTGTKTLGEVWWDNTSEKYYECIETTTDTFINLDKWVVVSVFNNSSNIKSISTKVTALENPDIKLLHFGDYGDYGSVTKLMAIPKKYTKVLISTTVSQGGGAGYLQFVNGDTPVSTPEVNLTKHSDDTDNFYYYFPNADGNPGYTDNNFVIWGGVV